MPVPFAGALEVAARGEREIVMTRTFDAPRPLVFDAFTKPELVRRWLLGPDGWTMPVCAIDLKVGGGYRYEWRKEDKGITMGVRGVYREISRPSRLVHTETFDESWYPGECVVTTDFEEKDGRTKATMTLLYVSARGPRRRPEVRNGARRLRELRPPLATFSTSRTSCRRLRRTSRSCASPSRATRSRRSWAPACRRSWPPSPRRVPR